MVIKGLNFIKTCESTPEQYDVVDNNGNQVAYVRLRYGVLNCVYPDVDGENLYHVEFDDEWMGKFKNEKQRQHHLEIIADKIIKRLENPKKCLVIIDMQNDFINEHTEYLPRKILEHIHETDYHSIVATRYVNHEYTACYRFEGWKKCMPGTAGEEIVDELKYIPDRVFNKDTYSCWTPEFQKYVECNHFDKLTFVGVNTGCCVLASAFDSYNALQDCEVIANLCGSTSGPESHKIALQILRENITTKRVI